MQDRRNSAACFGIRWTENEESAAITEAISLYRVCGFIPEESRD